VGEKFLKIQVEDYVRKKEPQLILIRPFKEKEGGEGRSQLGGQWKEKEKLLSTSFHFPPNKFNSNFHFFL
jgi:hypothetical protein